MIDLSSGTDKLLYIRDITDHSSGNIRVVTNCRMDGPNQYLALYFQALARYGVRWQGKFHPTVSWAQANVDNFEVVHFHWPEFLLRRKPLWAEWTDQIRGGWRLSRLAKLYAAPVYARQLNNFLRAVKREGKAVVWTVHNLDPHERSTRTQQRAFRNLAAQCDLVICHDEATRERFVNRYGACDEILVMPHGNYKDGFPLPSPADCVRANLGIDTNAKLVSCLGSIRQYKGVDIACAAMEHLPSTVKLLVGGEFHESLPNKESLREVDRSRVILIDRRLTAQEYADFAEASDAILLPYREVTGSGALLAALTFGRGVVASNLPYFRNILASEPLAGALCVAGNPRSLADAVARYLEVPGDQRNEAARRLANRFDWDSVVKPVADALGRRIRSPQERLAEPSSASRDQVATRV